MQKNSTDLENSDYKRAYYLFNIAILALVTISQLTLYLELQSLGDSTSIINLSGKQRMLSQKIVKQVYYFRENESSENEIILRQSLVDFANNHDVLMSRDGRFGISGSNNRVITEKLKLLSAYIDRFQSSARCILGDSDQCELDMETYLLDLKRNEVLYLSLIDNIVFSFEQSIRGEIRNVKLVMLFCFFLFSIFIIVSGKFVFTPIYERIIAKYKDISKKKEDSLKKFHEAELSTLTATVSHEIKKNILELKENLDGLKSNDPEVIDGAYDKINNIASEVNSISVAMERATNKQLVSNVEIFNLQEAMSDIFEMIGETIYEKEIRFDIESVDDTLFARGEKAQVSQVVINFITSAIIRMKDMSTKWIKLSATREGTSCVITIMDASYGLDMKSEEMYSPSLVSDAIMTEEGFNLWISSKILEKQNGTLDYDFSETHTSFRIKLPLPGSEYNIQI